MEKRVHLILGSESVYKREVFKQIFPDVETSFISADIDEKMIRHSCPNKLVLKVSHAKADRIFSQKKDLLNLKEDEINILITTDIVTVVDSKVLEKPVDEEEARLFLSYYGDFPHPETVCGVVVTNMNTNERKEGVDIVKIRFKKIPKEKIDKLIKIGSIFKTCGAITIEDENMSEYILGIDGEHSSVFGLPESITKDMVERMIKLAHV